MIKDYLCGVTEVKDRNGRTGIVANKSHDNITWIWNDSENAIRRLLTNKYSDLQIIRRFNKSEIKKF